MRLIINFVRSQGDGVYPMRTRGEGFFRCDRSDDRIFWRQKTLDFSKFMVCPHGQERLSQCGHFADKRRGSVFRDFMRTSFMVGPFWRNRNKNTENPFLGSATADEKLPCSKVFFIFFILSIKGHMHQR